MTTRSTRALVAHLFRRAGFGLLPDELDHYAALGVQGSVDYLIQFEQVTDPAGTLYPVPDLTDYIPQFIPAAQRTAQTNKAAGLLNAEARRMIQTWWVQRMLSTARPLQEKMVLFWHGHFATALSKVSPSLMLQQNQLFRGLALGNFQMWLTSVNQDPAMLVWLDGWTNRAGKPNENFSRELMELFALGIGNYTEQDVREGARALTGWTLPAGFLYTPGSISATFKQRFFDSGVKTYLNHSGDLGADDVMTILAAHPATGPFIARKLFEFFAYANPSDAALKPLVDIYYAQNYDIRAMVRSLLLSDIFYSDQAFQQHIKSPVEYVVGTVRELNVPVQPQALVGAMTLMGQELFNPPNVGGWPGGTAWVNEGTLVERFNFAGALSALQSGALDAQALVNQSGTTGASAFVTYLLTRFLGIGATSSTQGALDEYLGPALTPEIIQARVRGLLQLVLSTPEYQLN